MNPATYANQYQQVLENLAAVVADKLDLRSRYQLYLLISSVETYQQAVAAFEQIKNTLEAA